MPGRFQLLLDFVVALLAKTGRVGKCQGERAGAAHGGGKRSWKWVEPSRFISRKWKITWEKPGGGLVKTCYENQGAESEVEGGL